MARDASQVEGSRVPSPAASLHPAASRASAPILVQPAAQLLIASCPSAILDYSQRLRSGLPYPVPRAQRHSEPSAPFHGAHNRAYPRSGYLAFMGRAWRSAAPRPLSEPDAHAVLSAPPCPHPSIRGEGPWRPGANFTLALAPPHHQAGQDNIAIQEQMIQEGIEDMFASFSPHLPRRRADEGGRGSAGCAQARSTGCLDLSRRSPSAASKGPP